MESLGSLGGLSNAQKDELMDQVKQQLAVANAQELLTVSLRIVLIIIKHLSLVKVGLVEMTVEKYISCLIFVWTLWRLE